MSYDDTQPYDDQPAAPPTGAIVRQNFSGSELAAQTETAATAIAAANKAAIEARYVLALRNPRSWADVRVRLLKECARPRFAESAIYRKPVGNRFNEETREWEPAFIEGLSVRFAEASLRYATNIYTDATSIYDDPRKCILRITSMDLESNATIATDVTITKTVERRRLKRGQKPLSERVNSYGDTVYIVEATDDEVMNKTNALVSKAMRNNLLRLLPGDIKEECEEACRETIRKRIKDDPESAKRALVDSFAKLGVMPSHLETYLGHTLENVNPGEIETLRAVFSALRDGETTWAEIMDAKQPTEEGDSKKKNGAAEKVEKVLSEHKKKAEAKKAAKGRDKKDEAPAEKGEDKPAEDPAAGGDGKPEPGAEG